MTQQADPIPGQPGAPRWPWVALAAIIMLAAVVRIWAATDDLWLDELISLQIVTYCHTIHDFFTLYNSDNNHLLNTLYMFAMGDRQPGFIYRIPSIIFGVASVPLAYWVGLHNPRRFRILFAFLVALNYPLIQFSSEARGYAGAA